MANPIKETPTLTGKDAEKFFNQIKKAEQSRPSETELNEMKENFKKLEAITTQKHGLST